MAKAVSKQNMSHYSTVMTVQKGMRHGQMLLRQLYLPSLQSISCFPFEQLQIRAALFYMRAD